MIYLPPPQPVLNTDIRISGDVEIHPTASLAPGVILQAAPNSRIVIGADVCIGMGAIVNACQGLIEIDSGAILGSGVLIVGESKIGSNACVGTATTIFQASVAPMAVIEPGSIIGDISRQLNLDESQKNPQFDTQPETETSKNHRNSPKTSSDRNPSNSAPEANQSNVQNSNHQKQKSSSIPKVETSVESQDKNKKDPVVGQVYINQLLVTLFPHNKGLDSNAKNLEQ